MDFSFSDEQLQLRDVVRRFCDQEYPAERRGTAVSAEVAARRWRQMADMGLLGLPFDSACGGSGLSAVELMLVMEELGRSLASEPYFATVALGGALVAAAASPAQAQALLPRVVSGELTLALGFGEPDGRYELLPVEAEARPGSDGYRLNGHKTLVLNGDTADMLLIVARTAGAAHERDGVTLFLVDRKLHGVEVHGYSTLDGRRAADIVLRDACIPVDHVLGPVGEALPLLENVIERAVAALCAEATGALDALLALTVDYVKVRKQFGVPLATFQALQHRLVDMLIACEQARSMAVVAAMAIDDAGGDAAQRRRLVSAAKVQVGNAGRFVGQQAIQMHGAMGMTDECSVGHYVKRLMVINQLFGDVQYHLRRFAQETAA
ncbi:acyl-CoA dehydrogenase family protein [Aromatoleum aromaticum]|uniref:Pimeloyl-CoA dehydrogenase n=1 Tax=Aromatoleum aromaticum (strain DSM 19018 / LMG 30748 / EbN1) TaxID=76114 RepID=Q5P017_AROAE|nr:acyl-CoA dehydrogenase [Aromatoleum aromaticum]NMG54839.1 acyl-CoA dehydrogenase [Aromatoleum aromaticum]CAI09347.1 putative pimeloyl-CoA dehydrogenase (EC 1.3.1.62) [Aromatoleum aromaticum EbN1]